MPFCVTRYRLLAAGGAVLAECLDNHQTRNTLRLERPVTTDRLTIQCLETYGCPATLFRVQCFAD